MSGWLIACTLLLGNSLHADTPNRESTDQANASSDPKHVFARPNLVAWCIVPFDASRRGPAARAEMVRQLGLERVAYDWRQEHVPSFEEEIVQYKKHGIEFFAFWSWHDAIEPLIRKHGIAPQIWVTLASPDADSQAERISKAADQLLPLVEKTRTLGLKLGLYNHGGWGGRPENLIAVCRHLREQHQADHVGIVYNFHHAHDDLDEFKASFSKMMPYLLCLNLNGMADPETVKGMTNKILPLGQGVHERELMRIVTANGYDGPIGILDHRSDVDAKESLQANLAGLDQILADWE